VTYNYIVIINDNAMIKRLRFKTEIPYVL